MPYSEDGLSFTYEIYSMDAAGCSANEVAVRSKSGTTFCRAKPGKGRGRRGGKGGRNARLIGAGLVGAAAIGAGVANRKAIGAGAKQAGRTARRIARNPGLAARRQGKVVAGRTGQAFNKAGKELGKVPGQVEAGARRARRKATVAVGRAGQEASRIAKDPGAAAREVGQEIDKGVKKVKSGIRQSQARNIENKSSKIRKKAAAEGAQRRRTNNPGGARSSRRSAQGRTRRRGA